MPVKIGVSANSTRSPTGLAYDIVVDKLPAGSKAYYKEMGDHVILSQVLPRRRTGPVPPWNDPRGFKKTTVSERDRVFHFNVTVPGVKKSPRRPARIKVNPGGSLSISGYNYDSIWL